MVRAGRAIRSVNLGCFDREVSMRRSWYVAILAAGTFQTASAQGPVVLKQTIDLPQVEGRIDHLALDAARQQMFVAALGNNTVEVLDLAKGVRARSLPGFHEPQGIVVLPDSNLVAVANGQSGDLVLLDAHDGSVKRTIPLSEDADNVRYDAAARCVYVAHGSGAISAVDPAKGQVLGEVRLPGHPESFQLERGGSRMYANVPAAGAVAVINRQTMKLEATWPLAGGKANYPLVLDEEGHRLFVGCRQPAKVLIFDTASGRQVGAFEISGDTDDLFFDAVRKRLYISCGEGFVDVFQQQDASHFTRAAHVTTAPGARTSLYVPEQNRLYLAVPHRGGQKAEIRVYEVRD
jgi:DNA-binding beta-propeller fold protein YncE